MWESKEYLKTRSGERNESSRLQIQLEEDGDSSPRYRLMEKCGLWTMIRREN